MNRRVGLFIIGFLFSLPYMGAGQSCTILNKGNNLVRDRLCSPIAVNWDAGTDPL
jgi:hypothetical protein